MAAFDPGCVKTHTSAKCGKYNSPRRFRSARAQHDLTLMMRNFSEMFYARGGRGSFHTTSSRVEMWRGGGRPNISVAASFVWRCLTGSTMTPFPHPAHRTGHADLPHPALGQDLTPLLSRATPSAVSEHFSEFDRLPNLRVRHHVLRLS